MIKNAEILQRTCWKVYQGADNDDERLPEDMRVRPTVCRVGRRTRRNRLLANVQRIDHIVFFRLFLCVSSTHVFHVHALLLCRWNLREVGDLFYYC